MTLSIEITDDAPYDWNNFLLKNDTGIIHNTKEYAWYSPYEKQEPKFFRIIDESGNIKLQAVLLENKNQNFKFKILSNLSRKYSNIIQWNYGPVTNSQEAIQVFFNFLKKSKKRYRGTTHPLLILKKSELNFKNWATCLIDLSKEKDEIFLDIDKKSGRKNIERSQERGVEIEEITKKNLHEYIELYNKTKKRTGKTETTSEQMENFWRLLNPIGFSGFITRKDGICVGGMLFSFFNKYVNEWGVARSIQDDTEKLYSHDLIKWKIIEWGIKHKMNWYDLSGFNPNPQTEKEKGIMRYKKKWGGKEFTQYFVSN